MWKQIQNLNIYHKNRWGKVAKMDFLLFWFYQNDVQVNKHLFERKFSRTGRKEVIDVTCGKV